MTENTALILTMFLTLEILQTVFLSYVVYHIVFISSLFASNTQNSWGQKVSE
jgi:hypothetical protein